MNRSNVRQYWPDIALALAAACLFLANIGGVSIYIVDEARNATAAFEMYQRGDWIVPTYNGALRVDKPPLHYYVMRGGYALFGKGPFGARIGSALCGLVTLLLLWRTAHRTISQRAGRLTALIFLSALYVPLQFHLATPDPYLALCFTAGMLLLFRGWKEDHRGWLIGAYVLLGLGVLAKGPVAPALGALSVLVFLVISRSLRWETIWRFRPLLGLGIILLVAAPWFLAVHFQTDGAWTQGFFLEHNLERFADTKEGHGGIFLLIPAFVLLGLLPFGLWLPEAIVRQWRRTPTLVVFAICVVLAVVGFFSISQTKLPSYPFPAFPFAALVLGAFFDQWLDRRSWQVKWPSQMAMVVLDLLALAIPIGIYYGFEQHPQLGFLAEQYGLFLLVPAIVLAGGILVRSNRAPLGLIVIAAAFLYTSFLVYFHLLPAIDQKNQVARSLPFLEGKEVVYYRRFAQAYAFYLGDPKPQLETPEELTNYLARTTADTVYIVTTHRVSDDLEPLDVGAPIFRQKDLFELPITEIYRYPIDD